MEFIWDFFRIDNIVEEYQMLYLTFALITLLSLALFIYFIVTILVSYIWMSKILFNIFKNSENKLNKILTFIPIYNISLLGVITKSGEQKNESHLSFVALITTSIVLIFLPYTFPKILVAIALVVHTFDVIKRIVNKYDVGKMYFWSLFLSPALIPLLLKKIEEQVKREKL